MELRELRIDRFGCWEDLTINSLPAGLSVLHLDDGGRPADLVDFVHRVAYGFETDHHTAHGGALIWDEGRDTLVVDRQTSSRGQTKLHVKWNGDLVDQVDDFLSRARVSCPSDVARHFFFSSAETPIEEHWEWLSSQPHLIKQLGLAASTVPRPPTPTRKAANRTAQTQKVKENRAMADLKLQRLRGERTETVAGNRRSTRATANSRGTQTRAASQTLCRSHPR